MIFKRTAAGLLELLEVTDLAAEVTKTNALIDCFTSNAVRRVLHLKYIIMRHESSCHVGTGGPMAAVRHQKCKIMQDNQGQDMRKIHVTWLWSAGFILRRGWCLMMSRGREAAKCTEIQFWSDFKLFLCECHRKLSCFLMHVCTRVNEVYIDSSGNQACM